MVGVLDDGEHKAANAGVVAADGIVGAGRAEVNQDDSVRAGVHANAGAILVEGRRAWDERQARQIDRVAKTECTNVPIVNVVVPKRGALETQRRLATGSEVEGVGNCEAGGDIKGAAVKRYATGGGA